MCLQANYRKQRENLVEAEIKKYKQQKELIRRTEEFIRQNIAGQKTKQAQSRRKMLERMDKVDISGIDSNKQFKIQMNIGRRGGNKVVEISNLGYSYDGKRLFDGFSTIVARGEKIGVVGPNGCGKTTLMKLISGHLPVQTGEIKIGAGITMAYFSQTYADIPDEGTPYSVISDFAPYLSDEQVRAHLGAFSISDDNAFRPMKSFSGGERSRVAIASLVLSNANLLILDEPTNHLDILSRQVLENALKNYSGTAIVVSHDRYFLDSFVNKIWAFEHGRIGEFIGDFSRYLEKQICEESDAGEVKGKRKIALNNRRKTNSGKSKYMMKKLEARLEQIESKIAELEDEQQKLINLISQSFVSSNYERYRKIADDLKNVEQRLKFLWDEWEEISTSIENTD